MDTPIYDAMVREAELKKLALRRKEEFEVEASRIPQFLFNIEKEDLIKLKYSLLHALLVSLANLQGDIHEKHKESSEAFNDGARTALALMESIMSRPEEYASEV